MLARTLLLPIILASALAHPIPTSTRECSPLLALLSSAAGIMGLDMRLCAESLPSSTTEPQQAEPAYPESAYDDMDDPAGYGDWPLLPDWRETEKKGNLDVDHLSDTPIDDLALGASLNVDDWAAMTPEEVDELLASPR